jgi:hypothetical protein
MMHANLDNRKEKQIKYNKRKTIKTSIRCSCSPNLRKTPLGPACDTRLRHTSNNLKKEEEIIMTKVHTGRGEIEGQLTKCIQDQSEHIKTDQ